MNQNVKNQLDCIISRDEQICFVQAVDNEEECLMDEPSANYEMMFEYTG